MTANSQLAIEAGQVVGQSWHPTAASPVPSVRCTYTWPEWHDRAGDRCKKWSIRGATVCMKHGGQIPKVRAHAAEVVELARIRVIGLTDDALDGIEDLMQNAVSEAVRLKTYTEVLDRAGIRGGHELDVSLSTTNDPAQLLRERIISLHKRTVDAEVLSSTAEIEAPPPKHDTVSQTSQPEESPDG